MAPSNDICYYGLHFGCLNALHDTECKRCAERLTHAVQSVLHPAQERKERSEISKGPLPNNTADSQSSDAVGCVASRGQPDEKYTKLTRR